MKVFLIIILVLAAGVFYSLKIAPKKKEEEEVVINETIKDNYRYMGGVLNGIFRIWRVFPLQCTKSLCH